VSNYDNRRFHPRAPELQVIVRQRLVMQVTAGTIGANVAVDSGLQAGVRSAGGDPFSSSALPLSTDAIPFI
jgi:hypothetical protein